MSTNVKKSNYIVWLDMEVCSLLNIFCIIKYILVYYDFSLLIYYYISDEWT